MNKPLRGAKGGGKSGGSQSQRTPYEAPDNLLADSTARVLDVVSEGEIEGWADPAHPAKCIYFDDTPLQNPDGSYNFSGVWFELRTGTPNQEPVPGFSAVENEIGVSAEVKHSQPISRTITAEDVDAVRIKVGVNQLSTLDKNNGNLLGAQLDFSIDMQAGNGGWVTLGDPQFKGKTTSGYQRSYRIDLPPVRPVSIRVRRRTPDRVESNISDDLFFVSYTEIIDAKLRYPDTAYVALAIPAQVFGGRVPRRSYRLKGMKCWVPSNYDPVSRSYNEAVIWDGTFKLAYSNNPAFFTYTVFLENRWGLGERIAPELVDKWRIYQIGKYCDENVPDGLGGWEPRFTMNGVMNTREAAYQVITQLSTAFRGVTYWGAGAVVPVQDAPADPVKLVTNANVVDGAFNYAGTGLNARKTAVVASFRTPDDHYKLKAGIVYEDHDAIQRYNRRQSDINLPFTTSRGEALRAAKWLVDTDTTQRETVNYQAGYDHAALRPGDRILISDKHRVGFRMGGRVLSIAEDRLSLSVDDPVTLQASETYSLLLANDLGDFVEASLASGQDGSLTTVNLSAPMAANIRPGTVFIMTASNLAPRQFRVLSNTPEKHLFNIVALEDDPNKFARIEHGIRVDETAPYILPGLSRPRPVVNITSQVFYRASPAGLVATISWQVQAGEAVAAFQIDFTDHLGVRRTIGEQAIQSVDIALAGAHLGPFTVYIRARNVLNAWSEFASHTFVVDPELLVPGDVTSFRIRIANGQAFLTWSEGDAHVIGYNLRHAASAETPWDQAAMVAENVSSRELSIPAVAGRFLIKAVSVFDRVSRNASEVSVAQELVTGFNFVEARDLGGEFSGELTEGLVRERGGLVLMKPRSMFEGRNMLAHGPLLLPPDVMREEIFESSEVIDLKSVHACRVSCTVRAYGFKWDSSIFSGRDMFTERPLLGEVDGQWSLITELQHTADDPTSDGAIWSDWARFSVDEIAARGFKFRARLAVEIAGISARIEGFSVSVDMPDRTEHGTDINCPQEGRSISFARPFRVRPRVHLAGQELPAGGRIVTTDVTPAGFQVRSFNADDQPISSSFDFTAFGY